MPPASERRRLPGPALALVLCLAGLAGPPAWARGRGPAPREDIGPPPARGSEEEKADLAVVLWAQRTRTPEDVARAVSEVRLSLETFAGALGVDVEPAGHPLTCALLERAARAVQAETGALKKRHARPRPFAADPRVEPAIERERTFSYPSGHATLGVVWAGLLAELRPERAEVLHRRGLQVGTDRVLVGLHWPSDVDAGQRLGARLLGRLRADPSFRQALEAARQQEWSGP